MRLIPAWVLLCCMRMLAWFSILLSTKWYRQVLINLILAYPDMDKKTRKQLAKKNLHHQASASAWTLICWMRSPNWSLNAIDTIHNEHILDHALQHKNGMLVLVPHLGVWEVMSAYLCNKKSPTILYKPSKNAHFDALIKSARTDMGATLVPTDSTGVAAVFRNLKNGGFSIVLPDHVPDAKGGVIAPFFGINTLTGTLVPKLAKKTECALIGMTCIPTTYGRFDIFCYDLSAYDIANQNIMQGAAALNDALAHMIDTHTAHYLWSYRRFKHLDGMDNIYQKSDDEIFAFVNAQHKDTQQEDSL